MFQPLWSVSHSTFAAITEARDHTTSQNSDESCYLPFNPNMTVRVETSNRWQCLLSSVPHASTPSVFLPVLRSFEFHGYEIMSIRRKGSSCSLVFSLYPPASIFRTQVFTDIFILTSIRTHYYPHIPALIHINIQTYHHPHTTVISAQANHPLPATPSHWKSGKMTALRPRGGGPTPVGGPEDEVVVHVGPRPTYPEGVELQIGPDWARETHRWCTVILIHYKDPQAPDPRTVRSFKVRASPEENNNESLPVDSVQGRPTNEASVPLGTNKTVPRVGERVTVFFRRPCHAESTVPYKAYKWRTGFYFPDGGPPED